MAKQIIIEVPEWIDEEKLRIELSKAISKVTKELTIEEVRKWLGIKPEELTEEIESIDVEELRSKEKERVKY